MLSVEMMFVGRLLFPAPLPLGEDDVALSQPPPLPLPTLSPPREDGAGGGALVVIGVHQVKLGQHCGDGDDDEDGDDGGHDRGSREKD